MTLTPVSTKSLPLRAPLLKRDLAGALREQCELLLQRIALRCKLFLIALIAFTTLIMVAGVVQQLITQRLGAKAILQLMPYVLPISLQFALPATILFAVCSVYGRISADNEVLAVMASGVPNYLTTDSGTRLSEIGTRTLRNKNN